MIGTLIGGALGLGASIFGGIKASSAAKKAKQEVESQRAANDAWYMRRSNEDATQRADAQRVLTMMYDQMRRRSQNAAGSAAVMGTGGEMAAMEKEAQTKAVADTMSQMTASAASRQDAIDAQYRNRDAQLSNQVANIEQQRAGQIAQATAGAAQAIGGAATAYDEWQELKKGGKS